LLNISNTTTSRTGLFSSRLVRELAVVLVIKLVILYFIWFAFFSEPVTPRMTADAVSESFLSGGADNPSPQRHNNIK
jgi:RsiW-degrading membrane proteinase PrsW (M82 family)